MTLENGVERLDAILMEIAETTPVGHPDLTHIRRILQHNTAYKNSQERQARLQEYELKSGLRIAADERKIIKDNILPVVSDVFGEPVEEIVGNSRFRYLIMPRFASSHLFNSLLELPAVQIGRIMRRDHSTILYHISQAQQLISEGGEFCITVMEAERRLREIAAGKEVSTVSQQTPMGAYR